MSLINIFPVDLCGLSGKCSVGNLELVLVNGKTLNVNMTNANSNNAPLNFFDALLFS